jgi:CHAT domain-containing protein
MQNATSSDWVVVLSACDTGLGTLTGDGVVGLARSFFQAGVASVIVSLWAVPDAPTADLLWAWGLDGLITDHVHEFSPV